jgi:hypothetical protein
MEVNVRLRMLEFFCRLVVGVRIEDLLEIQPGRGDKDGETFDPQKPASRWLRQITQVSDQVNALTTGFQ